VGVCCLYRLRSALPDQGEKSDVQDGDRKYHLHLTVMKGLSGSNAVILCVDCDEHSYFVVTN
jgi:hypothetical protein